MVSYEDMLRMKHLFRFHIVRTLFSPATTIPHSKPVFGGRSLAEILILLGGLGICLGMTASSQTEGSGKMSDYMGAGLILLALRNNALTLLLGISWERVIFYHKFVGCAFLVCCSIHTYLSLHINDTIAGMPTESGLGLYIFCLSAGTVYFAFKWWNFELFYYMHILCYILAVPAAYLHNAKYMSYSIALWLLDMFWRHLATLHSFKADFEYLPGDVVRITLPEPLEYKALQYCFLMVPEISMLQFHVRGTCCAALHCTALRCAAPVCSPPCHALAVTLPPPCSHSPSQPPPKRNTPSSMRAPWETGLASSSMPC